MLRLITIALVVMLNSPEQLNSKYLLVEVADDSQVKNIETPGNGKGGNECVSDEDCPSENHPRRILSYCIDGECKECKGHEDCHDGPNPMCEQGYCIECYEDSDCPSETPLCDWKDGCGVMPDNVECGEDHNGDLGFLCRIRASIGWFCIDRIKVCDGNLDCPKGEDEKDCWGIKMSDDSASPDKQLLKPSLNSTVLNSREACGGRFDAGEKCVADHECNSYKCELDPIRHKGFRCEPCFGKKACHEPCRFNKECCSKKCACGSPSESICC